MNLRCRSPARLDGFKTAPVAPSPEQATDPLGTTEAERWLRCAACDARVAREVARISVRGTHLHEFMNPSGIRFTVACYSAAPGCMPAGERSTVWTWFPGHAWQIEVCRSCATHLGWSFHAPGASSSVFYGLIPSRLR